MAGFNVRSVLVTGAIGESWVFGTCRDPEGERAQQLKNLASRHPNLAIVALGGCPALDSELRLPCSGSLCGGGWELTRGCSFLPIAQAFLPLLKKAAQGSPQPGLSCSKAAIVNMSSEGGSITNLFAWQLGQVVSYRCSKAALNMLTKCQSLGYEGDGILSIAVHPGWVQTDMGSSASHQAPLTVEVSVQGILNVLSTLSKKDNGAFVSWEGKVLPW
uniref:C-factor-like n=1 Tax=Chelonoidis abingdonii TaxID=106734 RepID=A0A8C0HC50_CHEAB